MRSERFLPAKKLEVTLAYLKDPRSISELCRQHLLKRQTIHYWARLLLERADKVYEHGSTLRRRKKVEEENERLRRRIDELTETIEDKDAEIEKLLPPTD
jgi:transposase-like protein